MAILHGATAVVVGRAFASRTQRTETGQVKLALLNGSSAASSGRRQMLWAPGLRQHFLALFGTDEQKAHLRPLLDGEITSCC